MKIIEREYLEKLKNVMGTPDIKVITGVRRSGKSMLLKTFEEYVAKAVEDANLIHIDFNDVQYEFLREYHALHEYIEGRYVQGRRNFVMIDEVQMCEGFEKAINSLHSKRKYDIYVTGSNAFLLSSDLATLFAGRVFQIKVFPFSLKEYLKYFELEMNEGFERYVLEGGFAGVYNYDDLTEKYQYLREVYETMIMRDIEMKYEVKDRAGLMKISDFLMNNISRLTTGRRIEGALLADGHKISNKTLQNYLVYFCRAFAFYKVKRYDVKGKEYLKLQDKYYLCDHALRHAKLGQNNTDYGSVYENIVAVELMRRGYEVYVGVVGRQEIDFVAQRGGEKLFIQVAYDISNDETLEREVKPLLVIREAYPKMVIARTRQREWNYEGVRVVDIAEWLVG